MKAVKIETVIKNFEFAIKEYSMAIKELPKQEDKHDYLVNKGMYSGLCAFFGNRTDFIFENLWFEGYYSKIRQSKGLYLYNGIGDGLAYRLNWMKQEVKELKQLIKKGYTHI